MVGLAQLMDEIALSAFYDFAERNQPEFRSKIHKTRLENIYSMIKDNLAEKVVWLHAPAGVGKTTLAHAVAQPSSLTKKLAATFFFSRETPDCNYCQTPMGDDRVPSRHIHPGSPDQNQPGYRG